MRKSIPFIPLAHAAGDASDIELLRKRWPSVPLDRIGVATEDFPWVMHAFGEDGAEGAFLLAAALANRQRVSERVMQAITDLGEGQAGDERKFSASIQAVDLTPYSRNAGLDVVLRGGSDERAPDTTCALVGRALAQALMRALMTGAQSVEPLVRGPLRECFERLGAYGPDVDPTEIQAWLFEHPDVQSLAADAPGTQGRQPDESRDEPARSAVEDSPEERAQAAQKFTADLFSRLAGGSKPG